jgi:hypothetical protein
MNDVVISIDVEWAHPEVQADVVRLLAERNLRATFFCTHAGISVPGHERALHPNFRRRGNSLLATHDPRRVNRWNDTELYQFIVRSTQAFCPEAVGVRSHCLFYDSALLPVYGELGIQYESTYLLPLAPGLSPVWKSGAVLALPLYYMDHWDLESQVTGFALEGLRLDQPGLKVLSLHPNLIFTNAASIGQYIESKAYYHDPERLLKSRHTGRGTRTLFLELLDRLANNGIPVRTLDEINKQWRKQTSL